MARAIKCDSCGGYLSETFIRVSISQVDPMNISSEFEVCSNMNCIIALAANEVFQVETENAEIAVPAPQADGHGG